MTSWVIHGFRFLHKNNWNHKALMASRRLDITRRYAVKLSKRIRKVKSVCSSVWLALICKKIFAILPINTCSSNKICQIRKGYSPPFPCTQQKPLKLNLNCANSLFLLGCLHRHWSLCILHIAVHKSTTWTAVVLCKNTCLYAFIGNYKNVLYIYR